MNNQKHMSEAQCAKLKHWIASNPSVEALAIELLRCTGMRQRELVILPSKNFDLRHSLIHIKPLKGSNARSIQMDSKTIELVQRYIGDLMRLNSFGELISDAPKPKDQTVQVWRIFNEVFSELFGRDHGFSPHSLRHTFCLKAYEYFKDICEVRAIMGHKSVESTMRYLETEKLKKLSTHVPLFMG